MFSPVTINDEVYADGGILDNFPIDPLTSICDYIIGVYVSPISTISAKKLKHSYNVLDRAIIINFSKSSSVKFSMCDLLIHPRELNKYGLFGKNQIDEIFNIGYNTTLKKIKEYKRSTGL